MYGKIRVFSGGERLPRGAAPAGARNRRLLAAYLDRPLIPENFSASECWTPGAAAASTTGDVLRRRHAAGRLSQPRGLQRPDDWPCWPTAARFIPARCWSPRRVTTRACFFATGQDPVRKDVLEMLLRLFDREDLRLIPMVEFAAPLPELEAIGRGRRARGRGHRLDRARRDALLRFVAAAARTGAVLQRAPSAGAASDAPRGPRVGARYAGILRLPAWPCGSRPTVTPKLPGPDWGLDDATMARFGRDTNLRLPGRGLEAICRAGRFLA